MTTTSIPLSQRQNLVTVVASFLGFIGIGMQAGLLGIAWTPMSGELERDLADIGIVLFASTAGYLTISFLMGEVTTRLGMGRTALVGAILLAGGLAAVALSQNFWLIVLISIMLGGGSACIDAGLNTYIAEHHSQRTMNWLHACFGIGTTISPLIITAIISSGGSWRTAYWIVAVYCAALAIGLFVIRGRWRLTAAQTERAEGGAGVSLLSTLRVPVVWIGIALFFMLAGMETSPGTWMFPLYTKARGIDEATAGTWVSLYWGLFTVGRIFFGAIINYISTNLLIRLCLLGTLIGAGIVWWNPSPDVGVIGLILLGFAQAPMFAVFVSQTAARVGIKNAPNAIGFQVAGAGIGVAAVPALIGVLQERSSLEIIPPFLLVCVVILIALYELSMWATRRSSRMR